MKKMSTCRQPAKIQKSGSIRVRKGSEPDAKQAADKKRRASFMRDVPRTDTTLKGLTTIVPPKYFGGKKWTSRPKRWKINKSEIPLRTAIIAEAAPEHNLDLE